MKKATNLSKEISKELDFSPQCFRGKQIKLCSDNQNQEKLKACIEVIKKKYGFKDDYNLLWSLNYYIAQGIDWFNELNRQNPRCSDMREFIEQLKKITLQLDESVSKLIKMISHSGVVGDMLSNIAEAQYQKQLKTDIKNLQNIAKKIALEKKSYLKVYYENLLKEQNKKKFQRQNLMGHLKEDLQQFYFGKNESRISQLITFCDELLQKLPSDLGGHKGGSLSKFLIQNLVKIFHHGTGKMPTCGGDDAKGTYQGKFFNFLLEIKKLLNDADPIIKLGTDKTIGEYAKKFAIPLYKKSLKYNNK